MLGGCGSGLNSPPPPPPTITGLAATGAALANATVTAKCTTGPAVSDKTGLDGKFLLLLGGGQAVPCMVQVSDGIVTLHGLATDASHINVTPLTELVINRALGSNPALVFPAFDSGMASTIVNRLSDAKGYVDRTVTTLVGESQSVDPLTGVFTIGDANDKVLFNLKAALAANGATLDNLRAAAELGEELVTDSPIPGEIVLASGGGVSVIVAIVTNPATCPAGTTAVPITGGFNCIRPVNTLPSCSTVQPGVPCQ